LLASKTALEGINEIAVAARGMIIVKTVEQVIKIVL
jgi:hypothetical protein